MSGKRASQVHPRPDHIAELTRGIELPLPAITDFHLACIAEVLAQAWQDLLTRHGATLRAGGETEVNDLMKTRLNSLLDTNPIWRGLASSVTRGSESLSYDGSHLEKRPDLSIHLTRRNPNFPLTVECKLIDKPKGKTVGLYCRQGLARFVAGKYAWTAREAFMLAYARDGASIGSTLAPHLAAAMASGAADPFQTLDLPRSDAPPPVERARSRHERPFRHLNGNASPGPIVLWHLWLTAA